jgi:hypothetical protein
VQSRRLLNPPALALRLCAAANNPKLGSAHPSIAYCKCGECGEGSHPCSNSPVRRSFGHPTTSRPPPTTSHHLFSISPGRLCAASTPPYNPRAPNTRQAVRIRYPARRQHSAIPPSRSHSWACDIPCVRSGAPSKPSSTRKHLKERRTQASGSSAAHRTCVARNGGKLRLSSLNSSLPERSICSDTLLLCEKKTPTMAAGGGCTDLLERYHDRADHVSMRQVRPNLPDRGTDF